MRIPILPTVLVLLAAAAMVALGVWQLDRAGEKRELKALFARNLSLPPTAAPVFGGSRPELTFRRATATCLSHDAPAARGGEDRAGRTGYRLLVRCRTGAEGPGLLVEAGVAERFDAPVRIPPGPVSGILVPAPTSGSVLGRLAGERPSGELMLVLDDPPPGLRPAARPDPATIPDNHLAYAVQWFAFALIALVIYGLALVRRGRRAAGLPSTTPPSRG